MRTQSAFGDGAAAASPDDSAILLPVTTLLHDLTLAVNAAVTLLVLWLLLAVYRQLVKSLPRATGDAELAGFVQEHRNRWTTHRLAVATVDLRSGTPVRSAFIGADGDTPFELGTASQALTGLLLSDAAGRHEVALDQPLSTLAPDLAPPLGERTLRSLATHTSGLPDLTTGSAARMALAQLAGLDPFPHRGPDLVAVASRLRPRARGFTPSVVGAALCGQLIARRAGTPFADLLQRRVLGPLGLDATSAGPDAHRIRRGWTSVGRRAATWRADGHAPAVGVVTTLTDMTTLVRALASGRGPGHAALSPRGAVEISPHRLAALLWQLDADPASGRRLAWQSGQSGGYSAYLAVVPEAGRGVVVLSDCAAAPLTKRLGTQVAAWLGTAGS